MVLGMVLGFASGLVVGWVQGYYPEKEKSTALELKLAKALARQSELEMALDLANSKAMGKE